MKTRAAFSMDGSGGKNTTDPATVSDFRLDKANLGTGDCNNDLTTSTTTGDTWTAPFTGTGVSVYAPKESGDGKIEIQVDGQMKDTVDLSTSGSRQPQQLVSAVTGLTAGQHFEQTISNPNRETEHDPRFSKRKYSSREIELATCAPRAPNGASVHSLLVRASLSRVS